eukprot:11603489-Alexandrium_andersonii.AAC.1
MASYPLICLSAHFQIHPPGCPVLCKGGSRGFHHAPQPGPGEEPPEPDGAGLPGGSSVLQGLKAFDQR